jgi:hypothetical protein
MLAVDALERLIDFAGSEGAAESEATVRKCKRAIQDALRGFPELHRWKHHYSHERLFLKAPYDTGTVEYDATTRALTLTGGVWPAWSADANVRIDDLVSKVYTRDSDTVLTLDSVVHPEAAIAAGTTYKIYLDQYDLQDDYLANDYPIAKCMYGALHYVHPSSHLWLTRSAEQSGSPAYYTILPSRHDPQRFAIAVSPFPDSDQTLDILYQRRMRRLRYFNVDAGTASTVALSNTVAGVGTAWAADMIGATLRLSADTTPPTGSDGNNLAAFESVVTAVASPTSLTVANLCPVSLAGVATMLSDRLDLEDGTMATAFCWQAIQHLAAALRMKDRPKVEQEARDYLIRAREADARDFSPKVDGPQRTYGPSRRYMPTGPDE